MFLQGDLQAVFDALYSIGAIDPVLQADWGQIQEQMEEHPELVNQALEEINACAGDRDQIIQHLNQLDTQTLTFVALEVARELAEFTDRQALH